MEPILFLIVFVMLGTFAYAGWRGAPWVPTKAHDLDRFLKIADLKPGQTFVDLGCGDGRLAAAAASKGAHAKGYDLSLFPFILAQLRRLRSPFRRNISIKYRDIWSVSVHDADVVYSFLMPKINDRLRTKLEKELKKGAKVITYVWPIKGWTPTKIDDEKDHFKIYLYQR